MKSIALFICFCIFFTIKTNSQDTFQRVYQTDFYLIHEPNIFLLENEDILTCGSFWVNFDGEQFFLAEFSSNGDYMNGIGFHYEELDFAFLFDIAIDSEDNRYILFDSGLLGIPAGVLIAKISSNNEFLWSRKLSNVTGQATYNETLFIDDNNQVIASFRDDDKLKLVKVSPEGEIIWNKKISYSPEGEEQARFSSYSTVKKQNGNYLSALKYSFTEDDEAIRKEILLEYNSEGEIVDFSLMSHSVNVLDFFSNGDLILLGQEIVDNEEKKMAITRMNTLGEVIWTKYYDFSNLGISRSYAKVKDDKIIVLTGSLDNLSSILTKLTEDGEILWTYSYEGFTGQSTRSKFVIDEANNIIFHSKKSDILAGESKLYLTKVTENGILENGNYFEACLDPPTEGEFTMEEANFNVQGYSISPFFYTFAGQPFNMEEVPLVLAEKPSPIFNIPSRLCIDQCTILTGLQNENASSTEWYIENGTPETSSEADPGQICFENSGVFTIRQRITYDNCEEFFEKTIEIVEDLDIDLGEDLSICPDDNLILDATTPTATNYQWSNGSNQATSSILQSGQYFVTVSNEECEDIDSIYIFNVADSLAEYPIALPEDTLFCFQNAPLDIETDYLSFNNITWQNGSEESIFSIYEEGTYFASTEVGGCVFEDSINVELQDCEILVFLPNAFSPNNDGINDLFKPLGENFILLEMSIYNRWGALVFHSKENAAAWDGHYNGKLQNEDVFVYTIRYQNLLLGEERFVSGDLSLFW